MTTTEEERTRPRVAIYCRVSTDRQEREGTSLDTQLARCRDRCAAEGWDVVAEEQEAHSGTDLAGRPKLKRIRAMIRDGQVDVLVIYAVDRLARDLMHSETVIREALRHGVRVVSVTEPIEGSMGVVVRALSGALAQHNNEDRTEKMTRGAKERVLVKGLPPQKGKPKFGLRPVTRPVEDAWGRIVKVVKLGYEADPRTAPVLQRIFREYDADGSLEKVAFGLMAEGVPSPGGGRVWYPATVRDLLVDRRYLGEGSALRQRVETTTDDETGKKTRVVVDLPPEEWAKLPEGTYPALIPYDVFERVQRRLAENKAESQRRDRDPQVGILRRGFARCGYCGRPLVVNRSSHSGPDYRCDPRHRKRGTCPGTGSAAVEPLDAEVWDKVKGLPLELERLLNEPTAPDDTPERIARMDGTLTDLDAQRARLRRRLALIEDDGEAAEVAADLNRLVRRSAEVRAGRDALSARATDADAHRRRIRGAIDHIRGQGDRMDALGFVERRRVLAELGCVVRLFRTSDPIRWDLYLIVQEPGARIYHRSVKQGEGPAKERWHVVPDGAPQRPPFVPSWATQYPPEPVTYSL